MNFYNYSYQQIFNAIAAATKAGGPVSISVKDFREYIASQIGEPPPAQAQPVADGVLTDSAIERAALKHVATSWNFQPVAAYRTGDYKGTEQFRRLKAFALELLATQPVADAAPRRFNWTRDGMEQAADGAYCYASALSAKPAGECN